MQPNFIKHTTVIVTMPDANHYGDREPHRNQKPGNESGSSKQDLVVGILAGVAEFPYHATIHAGVSGIIQEFGFTETAASGWANLVIIGIICAVPFLIRKLK